MKFTVEIECDNAAFHDCGCEAEVIRILQELIERIDVGESQMKRPAEHRLHDINGNNVGKAGFTNG